MSWVKWDKMCSPREKRWLRIKNLKVFNKALVGKWLWRLMVERESLWGGGGSGRGIWRDSIHG